MEVGASTEVCGHPSQLSVPEVPTTGTSSAATLLAENINSTSLLEIEDNNSI